MQEVFCQTNRKSLNFNQLTDNCQTVGLSSLLRLAEPNTPSTLKHWERLDSSHQ